MSRHLGRIWQTLLDVLLLSAAFWLAFMIRLDWEIPFQMFKRLMFTWPYVVLLQFVALSLLGVTRQAWRHFSLREATHLLGSIGVSAAVLAVVRAVAWELMHGGYPHASYAIVPLGAILIDAQLAFLLLAGVRALRRTSYEKWERRSRARPDVPQVPTMLVGAGSAGAMVARELASWPSLGLRPVGFLDDDPAKQGTVIHGIPVVGPTSALAPLCEEHEARQVLITIANAPRRSIDRIVRLCEEARVPAKIIPGIYEIVGGKVQLDRIRPVAIEDLLGREPVALDEEAIAGVVRGQVIMVTGAGGSIGAELCRQLARFGAGTLVLVDRAENGLFSIQLELQRLHPGLALVPCVGDVVDGRRMEAVLERHRPRALFHAAAHKHVPMMEANPGEAVKNNVGGTRRLADRALAAGVEVFVMVSTDKAVHPTSVMGATKRAAELYVQGLARRGEMRCVTVRFGNVLGSSGSVVPLFKEQIARGGPVTVTHPEMKRYFMTIPEAAQLVLQAATMGRGGEVFILDMGEPVRIVDLARDLIRLSGLRPDEDIEVRFSGVRPGEKLFEEIALDGEHADRTRHPKIWIGKQEPPPFPELLPRLDALEAVCDAGDPALVRERLRAVVPDYTGAAAPRQEPLPAEA